MPFSSYLAQKLLEKTFLGQDFAVTEHWISLHTADPGATGTNEASGGAYTRNALTQFTAVDDDGAAKRVRNVPPLFIQVSAGTYTHLGLWDAVSGGNFLGGGPLSSPATVNDGDFVIIRENDLSVLQS
ncbi:hypothetical protein F183_A12350 [Bryobacterales bacterium F-183]|nr:hypothetical protein F183_A12350 [Bryobacterales bacterium F-183]